LKEGDIVAVFGKLDNRIVERKKDQLTFGTLFTFLTDDQVCVIIYDNELWIGPKREISPAREQR
jgi:hypothetical protein